ncbi:unnamed protein product [Calypogeia fissa]
MACRASRARNPLLIAFCAGFMLVVSAIASPAGFDVRQHLSTTSRYGAGKALLGTVEDVPPPPEGCDPIHLNLVARHGTRGPTKKRIDELESLVSRLARQLKDHPVKIEKHPLWLHGYRSPWEGRKVGGELIPEGEEEMCQLAQRMRERFPQLFQYDYHPDVYPITATQVPRSAASAVAFGMGLFEGKGTLGASKLRAFSVVTDSKKDDIHLRFHESCMAYKELKKLRKPLVQKWQDEVYAEVAASISVRHALNLTTEDTASLWLLCKQEAAILDITDRACGFFTAAEVELLEWADDLEAHHLKGYGEAINYRMGVPLLRNVLTTMEQAISASEGHEFEGVLQVAKFWVAHAETIIPFSCLLGLFLEGPDVRSSQSEEPVKFAPRPPHPRIWKGSLVAPFGANTQLVLYKCPKDSQKDEHKSDADMNSSKYLVQVLHNEKPVTMPACNGAHFCPFTEFKENVAGPHFQYSFESLCSVETVIIPPKESWAQTFVSGIRNLFRWPCRQSPDLSSIQSSVHKEL